MSLWLLLLLPLFGAACIFIPEIASVEVDCLICFLHSCFVLSIIDGIPVCSGGRRNRRVRSHVVSGFSSMGITLDLGVDSVAMLLVLLTTLLTPLCVWGSFTAITKRKREYYAWLLILETAMLGVFAAQDLILFYVSFELTLLPMFFLIAIYGGKNRAHTRA